ncbi:MAG: hypothetical protein KY447_05630, partial [Actinobacteria bacterium]|nr:hypothetical protein [Actinomycetota bacterium]
IAEALAASRSVTIPSQLRQRLASDGRNLLGRLRQLAPRRPPIAIQRWSIRRIGLFLGVLAAVAFALGLFAASLRTTGLL